MSRCIRPLLQQLLPASAALAAVSLLLAAPASAQLQVYTNNFDGAQTFAPGVGGGLSGTTTTESVQGYAGVGPLGNQFGGNFLRNQTTGNPASLTTLTLTNLPAHTSIDVEFLLGIMDSWDGQQAPDIFNVRIDGTTVVFSRSFAIASGSSNYTPPPGGDIGGTVQRGFNGSWADQAFNMYLEPSLTGIAHTGSTLTVDFFASGGGWQGGTDESWGIENVSITLNGVSPGTAAPEAGSLTLALMGGALLPIRYGVRRLRRPYKS